jgi:hypothetical protein
MIFSWELNISGPSLLGTGVTPCVIVLLKAGFDVDLGSSSLTEKDGLDFAPLSVELVPLERPFEKKPRMDCCLPDPDDCFFSVGGCAGVVSPFEFDFAIA